MRKRKKRKRKKKGQAQILHDKCVVVPSGSKRKAYTQFPPNFNRMMDNFIFVLSYCLGLTRF
jgi:predicted dinucleotide-utilizing enzyme